MTPKMANRKQVKIEKAEVLCESNKSLLLQFDEAKPTAIFQRKIAEIAQLVEHDLAKVGVAGSSPVFRSRFARNPMQNSGSALFFKQTE